MMTLPLSLQRSSNDRLDVQGKQSERMRTDVESRSGESKCMSADFGEAVGAPLSCGKVYRRKLD
jgi:hypothetical protein